MTPFPFFDHRRNKHNLDMGNDTSEAAGRLAHQICEQCLEGLPLQETHKSAFMAPDAAPSRSNRFCSAQSSPVSVTPSRRAAAEGLSGLSIGVFVFTD